jgi:Thiamine pyrophosphate enzyme, N-terminal TPP binding domain
MTPPPSLVRNFVVRSGPAESSLRPQFLDLDTESRSARIVISGWGEENLGAVESPRMSSIQLAITRHERAAAFMAATHGRLTGRPGVCISTLGPGARAPLANTVWRWGRQTFDPNSTVAHDPHKGGVMALASNPTLARSGRIQSGFTRLAVFAAVVCLMPFAAFALVVANDGSSWPAILTVCVAGLVFAAMTGAFVIAVGWVFAGFVRE